MKKSILSIAITALMILAAAGCEQPNAPQDAVAPNSSATVAAPLAKKGHHSSCDCSTVCAQESVATLWSKNNTAVGTVAVVRDGANLLITFTAANGWSLDESHLDIAAEHFCERGAPGKYRYKQDHKKGVTSYTYSVPNTWAEGTEIYIRAHAELKNRSKETDAFAGTIIDPKRGAWYGQFCYVIAPTEPPPPPTYTVSGIVFFDADNSGDYSADEPGIAGVTVELSGGGSTITDANGNYTLSGLSPGTYTVIGPDLSGYYPTSTLTKKFAISSADYSANFGYTDTAPIP
jgi:hypothetical protein